MTFNQWYNANSHLVDDPNGDAFTLAKEAWDYQQRIIQEQALEYISAFGQMQESLENNQELG